MFVMEGKRVRTFASFSTSLFFHAGLVFFFSFHFTDILHPPFFPVQCGCSSNKETSLDPTLTLPPSRLKGKVKEEVGGKYVLSFSYWCYNHKFECKFEVKKRY